MNSDVFGAGAPLLGFLPMDPMTEPHAPATQGALVEIFQMLSSKLDESHNRLRTTVTDMTSRIETKMTVHDKEDRAVADRVLVIETERKRDLVEADRDKARTQREIDRRMGAIALLMSVLGMVLGHFWK